MTIEDIAREHVDYRITQGMGYRDMIREVGAHFPPWAEPDRVDVELVVADAYRRLRQQRIEAELADGGTPPKPVMAAPPTPRPGPEYSPEQRRRMMAGR